MLTCSSTLLLLVCWRGLDVGGDGGRESCLRRMPESVISCRSHFSLFGLGVNAPHSMGGGKASTSSAADPGFDSRFPRGNFSGSSHTSDLNIGSPVATLPGAWSYRVSAWTGWSGGSILSE